MVCKWHPVVWAWVILYFSSWRRGRFKRIELENENRLKQAELDNLKTKLNPHFLFNALSSIRSLIGENPGRAQQAVAELAKSCAAPCSRNITSWIPSGKELEVVQHYLAIEKIRFEERLSVHYTIDPAISIRKPCRLCCRKRSWRTPSNTAFRSWRGRRRDQ